MQKLQYIYLQILSGANFEKIVFFALQKLNQTRENSIWLQYFLLFNIFRDWSCYLQAKYANIKQSRLGKNIFLHYRNSTKLEKIQYNIQYFCRLELVFAASHANLKLSAL